MDEILFEARDGIGRVTLNRPQALNALTHHMVCALDARLADWAGDDAIARVAIEGTGTRAFCAGGDIRDLHAVMGRGDATFIDTFYRDEYRLNYRIHTYPKPYVAIIDGVVMGGGVGVSIHGSRRIVTERALFAMPETGIGFFPDVGASWFLSRMPGELGMYLGLTGARLGPADALYCGVATEYVPSDRLTEALDGFNADPGPPPLAEHRDAIDRCFAGDSLEAIIAALEGQGGDWAGATLASLAGKSPISLKVTHRQLRLGASLSFGQAMTMEFRLSQRFCAAPDFREGVRAAVIDKDRSPQWSPPSLAEVGESDVEAYFAPPEGGDLDL
jgi:enoyl-CoA hydratase